jgi:hypothetical protein
MVVFFFFTLFMAIKWMASMRIMMKSALVQTISSRELLAFATPIGFPTAYYKV